MCPVVALLSHIWSMCTSSRVWIEGETGRGMEVWPLTHVIYWCLLSPHGPDAQFPLHRNFSLSWSGNTQLLMGSPHHTDSRYPVVIHLLMCFFSNGSHQSLLLQKTWFPSIFTVCAQCPSVASNSIQHLYPCLVSLASVPLNPEWHLNLVQNLN